MTLESLGPSMQLFPKDVSMKPKSIKIHSADTFGLVFKSGTAVVCKRALNGEIKVVARLFQSQEALSLIGSKETSINLVNQHIEFL